MPTTKAFKLNTGATIPWLGFGTGTALYNQDASPLVTQALSQGIIHLDGAQMYNNEDTLGKAINASSIPRSSLFVTTKLHLHTLAPGETVEESLKKSLAKLGLDYVDLFLIHDPIPATKDGKLPQVWEEMEGVYHKGLAKAIGISNFKVEDMKIVLESGKVVPAVNQIELHPYVWKAAEPIVSFAQQHGILIESYGGLTPVARVPGGPIDPVLTRIRERLEKDSQGKKVSNGQVLTKWLLQKDVVVVTTTTKVARIQEFLDAETLPDLTSEEINDIEAEGAKLYKRIFMHHCYGEERPSNLK